MKVGIPRERRPHENRVATVPSAVKRFLAMECDVLVEAGAGSASGFQDAAFAEAGAEVVAGAAELYARADLILKVQRPVQSGEGEDGLDEMALLRTGQGLIGMLDPFTNRDQVAAYAQSGVTSLALELLPRTSRAQSMDVLSSQASLAGYRGTVEAAAAFERVVPLMMTAAGTIPPARVLVLGAGVAGLQAVATARRLGAVVSATDVRAAAREEVESLGARFVGVAAQAEAGGYARDLTAEERTQQTALVADAVAKHDIVICAAQVFGRRAPILLTREMVESMPAGSVVVDLAMEQGGNCELSQYARTVDHNGVQILGLANPAARVAPSASTLYARNMVTFAELVIDRQGPILNVKSDDDLVRGTLLTHDGAVVNEQMKAQGGT